MEMENSWEEVNQYRYVTYKGELARDYYLNLHCTPATCFLLWKSKIANTPTIIVGFKVKNIKTLNLHGRSHNQRRDEQSNKL